MTQTGVKITHKSHIWSQNRVLASFLVVTQVDTPSGQISCGSCIDATESVLFQDMKRD